MALSGRDRRALTLGGVAVGVIVVYFLGVEPLWGWYDGLVTRHETKAAEVARIVGNERRAKYYAERVAEREKEVGALSPPKAYSEQITAANEKIVTAAGESGITLQNATPTAAISWPEGPELQQASITIDAEGGWENVFKFVGALYRLEGMLSVERLELSGDPKKGDKLAIRLTVSVLIKAPEQSENPWLR